MNINSRLSDLTYCFEIKYNLRLRWLGMVESKSMLLGMITGIILTIAITLFGYNYNWHINKRVVFADHMLGEQNRVLYSKDYVTIYYLGLNDTEMGTQVPVISIDNKSENTSNIYIEHYYINGMEVEFKINNTLYSKDKIEMELGSVSEAALKNGIHKIKGIALHLRIEKVDNTDRKISEQELYLEI